MVKSIYFLFSITLIRPIHGFAQSLFSDPIIISASANGGCGVFAADLDGDSDLDAIFSNGPTGSNHIVWCKNSDGRGTFGAPETVADSSSAPRSIIAADFDGDGKIDILAGEASYPYQMYWFQNLDNNGSFTEKKLLHSGFYVTHCVESLYAADLDNDTDLDILSATSGDNKIAWYENTDGKGSFSDQKVITTSANWATDVYAADLDGDRDLDVLSASQDDNKIAWYEYTDGKGSFSDQKVITTSANWATDVYAADLDGDHDLDVLSASQNDNKIASYENTDGKGTFGSQKTITTSANGAIAVYAADLDNDNDFDVISASKEDGTIAWYENTDGKGIFSTSNTITGAADGVSAIQIQDLDGDHDDDILCASLFDNKIAWHKNLSRETSVEENESEVPKDFRLYQNYPNPFNPSTTIRYNLPNTGYVTLKIHDLAGREIETLVNGFQPAGEHHVKWQTEGLTSGIYFCRLQASDPSTSPGQGFTETKKLMLHK